MGASFFAALLAALSIWDYPSRQTRHEMLRRQMVATISRGDHKTMEETCRKGVELLPDDPTWHYNLACALAYRRDKKPALDELEKAIDLGFRDAAAIEKDADLRQLTLHKRFIELIDYAREISTKPILTGPMAIVPQTGVFGRSIALGSQNLSWDFDFGCFVAQMRLAKASAGGNTGDLYFNRDAGHSVLEQNPDRTFRDFPGLTEVRFDKEGRDRGMDLNLPNTLFPHPVFGNCSRAITQGPYWRSLPRAAVTSEAIRMKTFARFYLSNQVWVFPACWDTPGVGTNGDVFASITPYFIVTAGRSWSDRPYLKAALEASRSFPAETKAKLVETGLLAPTIMTIIRQSLHSVSNETDYLSPKAHPTAFPANGVDVRRVAAAAAKLTPKAIPPLAVIKTALVRPSRPAPFPEPTYASAFATAFVLRSDDFERTALVEASGAEEFRFVQTHGTGVKVKIVQQGNRASITIDRSGMTPVNRVDIAVFGRNAGTGWGAPSYVSFARMDPSAPYSDPVLTPQPKTPSTAPRKTAARL